jgi:hypothetical protein
MYTISYHLAQARAADLRDQAGRYTLARAARQPGRRPGLRLRVLRRSRAVPGIYGITVDPQPRPLSCAMACNSFRNSAAVRGAWRDER